MPDDPASVLSPARLEPTRQLVGNNDEVTDLRFVGPPAAPTHVAVATNSEQVGPCLCARSMLRLFAVNAAADKESRVAMAPSILGSLIKRGWGSLSYTRVYI